MKFTHKWEVTKIDTLVNYEGNSNVVYGIQFKVTTSTEDSIYKVEQHSSVGFNPHTITNFQPYETLTEDIVLGWVYELLNTAYETLKEPDGITPIYNLDGTTQNGAKYFIDGVGIIESSGAAQLTEMIKPKIVSLPLPWVS